MLLEGIGLYGLGNWQCVRAHEELRSSSDILVSIIEIPLVEWDRGVGERGRGGVPPEVLPSLPIAVEAVTRHIRRVARRCVICIHPFIQVHCQACGHEERGRMRKTLPLDVFGGT